MADPNWLLSSLEQSSAAIVAIVGGLIAGRVISLNVEKKELIDKVDETTRELKELDKLLSESSQQSRDIRKRLASWQFFLSKPSQGIDTRSIQAEISRAVNIQDISPETEIASYLQYRDEEALQQTIATDYQASESLFSGKFREKYHNIGFPEFDRFRRENREELQDLNIEFIKLFFFEAKGELANYLKNALRTNKHEQEASMTLAQFREADRNYLNLSEKKAALLARSSALDSKGHLGWALAVLILFAAVGLIFPLILMPRGNEPFNQILYRWLPVGLFIFGLFCVIAYIAVEIILLKKLKPEQNENKNAAKIGSG